MRKKIAGMLVLMMACSLCACSTKENVVTVKEKDSQRTSMVTNETEPLGSDEVSNETENLGNSETTMNIEIETYLDLNTIPLEMSVEITDNAVIQTSPVSGWGYQTTEFLYDGDTLQSVQITALSFLTITDEDFDTFKQIYENMGYTDVKKEEVYKITAVCTDVSNSDFWSYVTYSKENLKKKLMGEEITDEIPTVAHSVAWSDIKYIPEGMPQLAESVSDDLSDPMANGFSVVWNELSKEEMETMKDKLEQWSGETFNNPSNSDLIVYLFNSDRLMLSIYYHETPVSGEPQCSITVSIYK